MKNKQMLLDDLKRILLRTKGGDADTNPGNESRRQRKIPFETNPGGVSAKSSVRNESAETESKFLSKTNPGTFDLPNSTKNDSENDRERKIYLATQETTQLFSNEAGVKNHNLNEF